ncbi:hypothetical protein ABID22_001414 [Pontibacter aydingkolensis]|uniref:DUF5329 domain-containing protein n=1 Tax=Pontibacter aydingkolensis TaxID=1911536 RepID=A0ABS7CP03_9BACT|nr:DUF5329 family protein [Pontibacter aydingkolensis]MBW7465576.1 DUF5329 domain-containing protein [Pontibacter aydingkolensis]
MPSATAGSVINRTEAGLTEVEKVDRLIQFVRGLEGATFIRNGSEHTCKQAADHLQAKWLKHKDKISSAREFIELLASKSGFSGEPYKIRFKDGTVQTTGFVLSQELKRLENL